MKRRVWVLTAAAATLLLASGCAHRVASGEQVVQQGRSALDGRSVCCKDLSTAVRTPLPLEPTEVKIDASAAVFDFGGNKAFFVLYELPVYKGPYSIVLSSRAAGMMNDVAVFVPRVALYDDKHVLTRFFDERTLRNRSNNFERTVFINPSNQGERYLAVYGSDLATPIERSYSMVTVNAIYGGAVMYSGVDGKAMVRPSPVGDLRIEVQGLAPASKK